MAPSSDSPDSRIVADDSAAGKSRPASEAFSARPLGGHAPRVVEGFRIVPGEAPPEKETPRVSPLGSSDPAKEAGLTEFVVYAEERDTGKPWPLFIVPAADRDTAYRLSQRRYLAINAVEPYVPVAHELKPPVCPWGPPASGRKFERDYHNRPPERDARSDKASGSTTSGLSPWITVLIVIAVLRLIIALLR